MSEGHSEIRIRFETGDGSSDPVPSSPSFPEEGVSGSKNANVGSRWPTELRRLLKIVIPLIHIGPVIDARRDSVL